MNVLTLSSLPNTSNDGTRKLNLVAQIVLALIVISRGLLSSGAPASLGLQFRAPSSGGWSLTTGTWRVNGPT